MAKLITAVVLLSLFLIFILQNAVPIVVNFLAWEIESPRAMVLFLVFLGGLLTGVLLTLFIRRRRKNTVSAPPIRYS
ncbi:MAG: lipopolysaccharide assembly protein LapA domain-containing protein [Tunicatimonas sp.]